jgi:site-specific DNA-adenine methylase
VGLNVRADRVIFSDNCPQLLRLYKTFMDLGGEPVLDMIDSVITRYGLSRSDVNGYGHYNCESAAGLAHYNREPFLRLRADFNRMGEGCGHEGSVMLYVLIVYAFNNQIRFNSNGEFNLPVGKRDFNDRMRSKLTAFIGRLRTGNYEFIRRDFRTSVASMLTEPAELTQDSLVYCDPPYLITRAAYNERDGWNERCERDLLALLDALDERRVRFALSNVLTAKGGTNAILADWLSRRDRRGRREYRVIHLNCSYANSNYQVKNRTDAADEVLIVNY